MHSYIFQVSSAPIHEDEYTCVSKLYDDDNIDYASLLESDEKKLSAINALIGGSNGIFYSDSSDSISISENLDYSKKIFLNRLTNEFSRVNIENIFHLWNIMNCIENPIVGEYRFIIEDWSPYSASCLDFMSYIESIHKEGKRKIYIGSVFDYHY